MRNYERFCNKFGEETALDSSQRNPSLEFEKLETQLKNL
jgi:hypothetical protein